MICADSSKYIYNGLYLVTGRFCRKFIQNRDFCSALPDNGQRILQQPCIDNPFITKNCDFFCPFCHSFHLLQRMFSTIDLSRQLQAVARQHNIPSFFSPSICSASSTIKFSFPKPPDLEMSL